MGNDVSQVLRLCHICFRCCDILQVLGTCQRVYMGHTCAKVHFRCYGGVKAHLNQIL